jgi:signal transduction histidine kinase
VLWAALRFQLRGAALSVAVLTVAAIYAAPLGVDGNGDDGLANGMMLPVTLGLAAVLGVLVGTLSLERRRALRAVEAANAELEARIEARTAELHARERELEAALQAAGENDRRKDEFLAMLGHELRNPLAPIRNVTSLLAQTASDHPTVAKIVPMMHRQVTQMTRLVDDLLDVARIAQGRLHVHVDEAAIDGVVEQALESVQPLLTARHQRVRVVREVVDARVRGDAGRLAQCVANLLTNAAKYSDARSEIELRVQGGVDAIEIVVRDSGSGIAPELLPHVFKPFVQGPRTLDRSDGGLGVGLAVVGRVVELHGGAVSAASAGAGQGSTFTIRLPRAWPAVIPERRVG